MKRPASVSVALLIAIAASAIFASTVSGASHQPDGWVRYEGFRSDVDNIPYPMSWKGKNVYNTTALKQSVSHHTTVPNGDYNAVYIFTITIQNDGARDQFKVSGGSSGNYYRGTTDITGAVVNGTYTTATLAAGATTMITVQLSTIAVQTALITISSVAEPSKRDAVKVTVSEPLF